MANLVSLQEWVLLQAQFFYSWALALIQAVEVALMDSAAGRR